jgi:Tfp pilus assembly protein PilF
MQNRQGMLAMGDFDQALTIKPDHIPALTERGTLRLAMNNASGARADFDAIANLAPNDPSLGLRIAQLYVTTRHFDEAINSYDRWITAYPKDARLAAALNGRCWSRAMMGEMLDLALADCNAALKKGLRASQVFDSRGMVFLRSGDFDRSIADFKASLKLQPKSAFTLYGLGVAQLKKGSKEEGDKNIQAAVAITPTIAESFKRLSLVP